MMKRRNSDRKESGMFMVMLAGMMLVLVTIVALFFASSFLSANKTRLQNSTNFAALGAIERYVRAAPAAGNPPLTYNERAEIARRQANALLDRQALLGNTSGGSGSVGALGYSGQNATGGDLEFGVWYPIKNASPPNPCGANPCFSPASPQPGAANPNPLPAVNAVKVKAKTPHPFSVPLLSLLGLTELDIESEAIAAVVPRCTVFVLDVSSSSQEQSHFAVPQDFYAASPLRPASGTLPTPSTFICDGTPYTLFARPHLYTCPRNVMPFAFDHDELPSETGGLIDPERLFPYDCNLATSYEQKKLWCNLEYYDGYRRRLASPISYPYPPPDGMPQLPDYYRVMDSPGGRVVVDTLNRPQPLSDFLLGFNAGTRMMIAQSSQLDKAGIITFRGGVIYKFPQTALSSDLGFLALATNADRINPGWSGPPSETNPPNPPEHPNFIDLGWFSRYRETTSQGSNVIAALDEAIRVLADPVVCPALAQKSVILASDGIMNCSYDALGPSWTCSSDEMGYSRYLQSENYLLGAGFDTGQPQDSILRRMQRYGISFSVLISGGSGPNIVNRFVSNPSEPNGGHFMSVEEARALGMTGMPPLQNPGAVSNLFVDTRSDDLATGPGSIFDDCVNDPNFGPQIASIASTEEKKSACAFFKQGHQGVYFRRPLGAFYRLATETGGWYCPFMPKAPASAYTGTTPDSTLTHLYRQNLGLDARLTVNPYNRNSGQDAGICVQQTLGLNPFVLVRE